MTPTEATASVNRAARLLQGIAKNLRSRAALSDAASIAVMLEGAALGMQGIEATEPIASSLEESLEPRAARVSELKTKIDSLRRLSDDVNTTPAEAGTAHRTANKLQAEHDAHADVVNGAHAAIGEFVVARDEFLAAHFVFSTRYESAKAAEPVRATRRQTEPPANAVRDTRGPVHVPETTANWVAIVAIAIPVGFIFAPALIPLAYFGPKWFRKPKTPAPSPRPIARVPAPRPAAGPPRPAASSRPPQPARASTTVTQVEDSPGGNVAWVGLAITVGLVMLMLGLGIQSANHDARRTAATAAPTQSEVRPAPAPVVPSKEKSECEEAKERLPSAYGLNDDCSALAVLLTEGASGGPDPKKSDLRDLACTLFPKVPGSVQVIQFAIRSKPGPGRYLTTISRSGCSASRRLAPKRPASAAPPDLEPSSVTPPGPATPVPGSFEVFEREQQARRDAAKRAQGSQASE